MGLTYRLVMRSGPTAGKIFVLDKNEMFIGRDLTNDIVINDPEVSRRHTRLFLQGANYVVEDLGSTNGTSVNGQRLMGPYILRPGEMVTLGEHVSLMFETAQPDYDATVASPSARGQVPPVSQPQPPLVSYSPPSQPVYSGQVPDAMDYGMVEPPRKKFPVWLIIVLVMLLMFICMCVIALWYIDANYLWCDLFGWFFGPQACP